jgi:hypothetical protein
LTELLKTATVIPAVNQVECHPHQSQPQLLPFCRQHGIVLTAYSPTGYTQVASDPVVQSLAAKYGVSAAQVSLAWHVARGMGAVPKSADMTRQRANLFVSGKPTFVTHPLAPFLQTLTSSWSKGGGREERGAPRCTPGVSTNCSSNAGTTKVKRRRSPHARGTTQRRALLSIPRST